MIETIMWIVIALVGLAISVSQVWLLAGKRPLTQPGTSERYLANSYILQELLAQAAYLVAIVVGIVGADWLIEQDRGWNWSVTTEGTLRQGFINYGFIIILALVVGKNAVRRVAWRRVSA